jgi:hypothetical protein
MEGRCLAMTNIQDKIKQELAGINQEFSDVVDLYYDRKTNHWRDGFMASNWNFYREFRAKHDYCDWNDSSVVSYLNFLTARVRNLKYKMNREFWKGFRRW